MKIKIESLSRKDIYRRIRQYLVPSAIIFLGTVCLEAQNPNRETVNDYVKSNNRKIISIPDIPGYTTLTGDFHMHTVFSDGAVWPVTRVEEAWSEGLDVIAITDHIEHRPKKKFVKGNLNTPFEIAKSSANQHNIILISGIEITRKMPPGHFNALFITDADSLEHEDPMKQIEEANKQGGFVLWNHPGWASQQPDTTLWWDIHTEIYEKGWLHGIEVFNSREWYPIVLGWCIEKDLTVFANSDIHKAIDQKYDLTPEHSHRPLTILFCEDRSEEGVRSALFEGRTLGWFGTTLVGREDLIAELCKASLQLKQTHLTRNRKGEEQYHYEFRNPTDLTFVLELGEASMKNKQIELLPQTSAIFSLKEVKEHVSFKIVNFYSDMGVHPEVSIKAIK